MARRNREEGGFPATPVTGKSHIAKALLLIGGGQNFRYQYFTDVGMLRDLLSGLADKSLEQKLKIYLSAELLLIGEVRFNRLKQHNSANACLCFTMSSTAVTVEVLRL